MDGVWLTGGAALSGFFAHHRRSEDLDMFTDEINKLDELEKRLIAWAEQARVRVDPVQRYPGFRRVRLVDVNASTLVDLVRDVAHQVVAIPDKPVIDGVPVDPPRELRANKLAAVLGPGETKDVIDLYALDGLGWPALDGFADAQRKDGGMDAATLAWVLEDMTLDLDGLLLDQPITHEQIATYRDGLVRLLRYRAFPGDVEMTT